MQADQGIKQNSESRRAIARYFGYMIILFMAVIIAFLPGRAYATQTRAVLIIGNDPGGRLETRIKEIKDLRANHTQVRITHGYCNSACTLYLGLRNTCVSRDVSFGFHGPMSQFYGLALPPDAFEYWSGVMAAHYPASIRAWYLSDARYTTVGLRQLSGRELIKRGVRECH